MSPRNDTDLRIGELAERQHGVVAHRQLRALGLSHEQIAYRLRVGRLVRRHPEVYTIGHAVLGREGRWVGAVLACGSTAAISHWDAAVAWDLLPSRGARIHVSRPSRSGRDPDPARIHVHRIGSLHAWERTLIDGIQATTVARTLLDLSADLDPAALEDIIGRAGRLRVFDLVAVRRCLQEHPRQHGAPKLRRLLDELAGVGAADLRSTLEVRFLQLCADRGLPRPEINARVAGFLVDFLWREQRLIVETDGYAYHSSRAAFERDRDRDQHLTLAGYTVLRFTYNQVTQTPAQVAARLKRVVSW